MNNVEEFLAYAIQVERDAADRFSQLADAMDSAGNRSVGKLFRQLADYSRMHLADAQERAGFRNVPKLALDEFEWPDIESPESAAIWAADPMIGTDDALETALAAELAGYEYYATVLATTTDPEIKALAEDFVAEESGHVAELQRWIAARAAGQTAPVENTEF